MYKHLSVRLRDTIATSAKHYGLDRLVLYAIVLQESGGVFFWEAKRPAIRPEGHYFYRLLASSPALRTRAVREGLASAKAGGTVVPNNHAARYAVLESMQNINYDAALMSISMGAGQIMGANYKMLGYENVGQMWADAHTEEGQIEHIAKFIASNKTLKAAVNAKDWATIARIYNGPAYKRNNYDVSLKNAFEFAQFDYQAPSIPGQMLADRGMTLAAFQQQQGLKVDGRIGKITEQAIYDLEQGDKPVVGLSHKAAITTAGAGVAGLAGVISTAATSVQDTLQPVTDGVGNLGITAQHIVAIITVGCVLAAVGYGIYKWARS